MLQITCFFSENNVTQVININNLEKLEIKLC